MKKLLLIRHAKAVHDSNYEDFERPLKNSGIKDAELMAGRLQSEGIIPELLITSPALRTQTTANIISEFLSLPKPVEDMRIYEAGRTILIAIVNQLDEQLNFTGIVGHNPTIEDMVAFLSGHSLGFPPGAAALIEFDLDTWGAVTKGIGTLKWYSSPKED